MPTQSAARPAAVEPDWRAAAFPDAAFPVHLTTGRVLAQYQSGAQTRRVRDLPDDGPFVELHPMLADRIGAPEAVAVTGGLGLAALALTFPLWRRI